MGIFRVPLQVGNPFTGHSETVEAVVDTGAVDSVMPTSLLRRLGIEPVRVRRYRTASGERVEYEVGWALFSAEGERCVANVVFGPEDNPLMGATTLEQLYLAVDPVDQRLVPQEGLLL
jgi:clan AA aspartic protease